MRRRQIYEAVRASAVKQAAEHVPEPAATPSPAKGTCPTCQKLFPRGLHLHTRACKGADQ